MVVLKEKNLQSLVSDLSLKAEEDRALGLVELVVVADNHALIDRAVLAEWYSVSTAARTPCQQTRPQQNLCAGPSKHRNRLEPRSSQNVSTACHGRS